MTYNEKSNDSFNARLRFYLFACILLKKDVHLKDFIAFDIDKVEAKFFVDLYITEYQQFDRYYTIDFKENAFSNDVVYGKMKALMTINKMEIDSWKSVYLEQVFQKKLSLVDFNKIIAEQNCFYCNISVPTIRFLIENKKLFKKSERGFNLELDRKSPNKEYSFENCVMACYWCNNAKTDEFDAEEFKAIGKAIQEIWEKRLYSLNKSPNNVFLNL